MDNKHPGTLERFLGLAGPLEQSSHGFCILFDIIDSTQMKSLHADWKQRFVFFYEAFCSLVDRITEELHPARAAIHKFLGDAAFVYIPLQLDDTADHVLPPTATCGLVVDHINKFRTFLAQNRRELCIQVKTVVTYVTHIQIVEFHHGATTICDALGQGVDFTFRLEKFSTGDAICMNSMFRDALGQACQAEARRDLVKGWSAPQDYHVLHDIPVLQYGQRGLHLKYGFQQRQCRVRR